MKHLWEKSVPKEGSGEKLDTDHNAPPTLPLSCLFSSSHYTQHWNCFPSWITFIWFDLIYLMWRGRRGRECEKRRERTSRHIHGSHLLKVGISPSTTWDPGIELRSPHLAASSCMCWALSWALQCCVRQVAYTCFPLLTWKLRCSRWFDFTFPSSWVCDKLRFGKTLRNHRLGCMKWQKSTFCSNRWFSLSWCHETVTSSGCDDTNQKIIFADTL